MKNLRIHEHYMSEISFIKNNVSNGTLNVRCAINPNNDDLYIRFNNELHILQYDNQTSNSRKFDLAKRSDKIIALEYNVISQILYCVYGNGAIIKIDISDLSNFNEELIYVVTYGLKCIKLSPDSEVLAAITKKEKILLLSTNDFDVIKEIDLYASISEVNKLNNVDQVKKLYNLYKKPVDEEKQIVDALHVDSNNIIWRNDSQFVIFTFMHKTENILIYKIFRKDGSMVTVNVLSETDNLVGWKLNDLIVSAVKPYNSNCQPFENDNLPLKSFIFPSMLKPKYTMTDLFWSPECDILVTIGKSLSDQESTVVFLWNESNSCYRLKQSFQFSRMNPLLYVTWSNKEIGKHKLILLSLNRIEVCSFDWCINSSRGQTLEDQSVVVVIDGIKLHVTAFKNGIIPPPLAHEIITTDAFVNAIVFAPTNNKTSCIDSNTFGTFDCNNIFTIYKRNMELPRIKYEIFKKYNIKLEGKTINNYYTNHKYNLSHFSWIAEDIILCSMVIANNSKSNLLLVLQLQDTESKECGFIEIQKHILVDKLIQHIVASPKANEAYIILDGFVHNIRNKYNEYHIEQALVSLNETCRQVDVINSGFNSLEEHVIIALTHTNRLLLNGREFSNRILSYLIYIDCLLYTTLHHTLVTVPINFIKKMRQNFNIPYSTKNLDLELNSIEEIKRVERDSFIITVTRGSKIILETPRGNLEYIEPKTLIVRIVKRYLDDCDYVRAFDFMKKQHMNFNLIYDHNPKLFIQNAEKFVNDIADSTLHLNLFLSALQDEDVSKTIYLNYYINRSVLSKIISNDVLNEKIDKVTYICQLLRDIMEKRHDTDKLIQPIFITLLKSKNKEGLKIALAKIKTLMLSENLQKPECSSHISAETALKYLVNAVDINALYDTALSMYDLELAIFVASKSQKDPKEYIPFLNRLKAMDENYMKYTIDMYLKNYELALVHIAKDLNRFDDCLNLICLKNLYKQALKLFEEGTPEYKQISVLFAKHLMEENKYEEAGFMFLKNNDLTKASEAFILASNWLTAIKVLQEMNLSPAKLYVYYQKAVTDLKINKKHDDAATILLDYLNDAEEAVAVLCEGRNWKRAMKITSDIQRSDLIETHIKPGIKEHANFLLSQLNNTTKDFLKYNSRLALLRSQMSSRQDLIFTDISSKSRLLPAIVDGNIDTMFSDTASATDTASVSTVNSRTSTKSGKSYRSSKNRRKQERKLLSLKEGSTFEDCSLITVLHCIVTNTSKNIDEWTHFLQTLMRFEFNEIAEKLQSEINNFIRLIQNNRSKIWNESIPSSIDKLKKNSTSSQFVELTALIEKFTLSPPEIDIPYIAVI